METTATVLFDIELQDSDAEVAFLRWWDEARALLVHRAHLTKAALHVIGRGHYLAVAGFPLPGGWGILSRDRRWIELESRRPPARVQVRLARLWRSEGNPRDISTMELARWIEERSEGQRDFVLVDTLPEASFRQQHIPGAVNFPLDAITEAAAPRVLGQDRDRAVVVYCSSYG